MPRAARVLRRRAICKATFAGGAGGGAGPAVPTAPLKLVRKPADGAKPANIASIWDTLCTRRARKRL